MDNLIHAYDIFYSWDPLLNIHSDDYYIMYLHLHNGMLSLLAKDTSIVKLS